MIARVAVWCKAAAIVAAGCCVLALAVVVIGRFGSRLFEQELLSNKTLAPLPNGAGYEYWTDTSDDRVVRLSQTVDTPFLGKRGNWRIVSTLHVAAPGASVAYAIEGNTHGEWTLLDRREIPSGLKRTKIVLEPRPLSPSTVPPDQLRVRIEIWAPTKPTLDQITASLRTGPAGVFNSLNPPTWTELAGLAVFLLIAIAFIALFFARVWRTPSPLRLATINCCLLVSSATFTLIALEAVARVFLVFPDSMATTRVSELWWARHWTPLNALGYRDIPHAEQRTSDTKTLFIVGDSFAAGHGIARFEDTFHQHLARDLGNGWDVVVIATPGMSTRDELDAIAAYPLKPDAIILAHVWNDVNSALQAHGIAIPGKPAMNKALRPIVLRSYFLDFVYWRMRGLRAPMRSYLDLILSAYEDGELWETHKADLGKFTEFAQEHSAPLLVATFPALEDVQGSRTTSSRVADYFRSRSIPVIDFAEVFSDADPRSITVNRFDSHPNEATHKQIADILYPELQQLLDGAAQEP